jgi:hypothetical protein
VRYGAGRRQLGGGGGRAAAERQQSSSGSSEGTRHAHAGRRRPRHRPGADRRARRLTAVALRQVGDAHAPDAVVAHDDLVALLQQVGDAGLHAGVAAAGGQQRVLAVGLEQVAEPLLDVVHDLEQRRVHVAQQRQRLGGQDARVGVAGAGAHQQARGHLHGAGSGR